MKTIVYGSADWRRHVAERRGAARGARGIEDAVRRILESVKREGDAAVRKHTLRFDGIDLAPRAFRLERDEVRRAARRAAPALVRSLRSAAKRIEAFHRRQRETGFRFRLADGSILGEDVRALSSVGLYVPGGYGSYPSSVLMNGIPARVAGVRRVVVATPPGSLARNPALAAALVIAGVDEAVYRIGGAQAIGALAYGTATIEPVDKIVGPGNAFVAMAKRLVRGVVEIDNEAGPSEVAILADGTAPADLVAADLLAQAEHGSGRERVVLVTTSRGLGERVRSLVAAGVERGANAPAARRALRQSGVVVLVKSLTQGIEAINALASEHAQVMTSDAPAVARRIVAGAVFAGLSSPVAVGDYGVGPNHVLPTGGTARAASPLSVRDFVRRQSFIALSPKGLRAFARDAIRIAQAEGFVAHAASVEARLAPRPRGERR